MLTIKVDTTGATATLGRYARQVPFALSRAINKTLFDGAQVQKKRADSYFSGGAVPFTKSGFQYAKSTKRNLTGTLYIEGKRAKYMRLVIDGGVSVPVKRALVQPVEQRTNKYGNMPKSTVKRLLNRRDTFTGTPKGRPPGIRHAGIWKRQPNGQLRMQISYKDRRHVRAIYPAEQIAVTRANAILPRYFDRYLLEAIKTAR